ncbi:hypothetical protein [Nocardia gipuzkoensis]
MAVNDVDPATGRARLSYRRAAELFETHIAVFNGGPYTLHQLRHSRLAHAAEDGASTPVLMKPSGHGTQPRQVRESPTTGYGVIRATATRPLAVAGRDPDAACVSPDIPRLAMS